AVGVAADIAVDGTDVEAGAATDAVKRVALFGVGEKLGAAVVEQYHVIVLRAIGFAGLTRPAVEGVVTRHGLSRAGGGEHRQEQGKVSEARQYLFDAEQRDHRPGQRGGEPGVAFVFGDGDHARLGNGEVRA